ncbi:MAG: hypothetical protein WCS70_13580 [Verrucomicrobiota bacterium]
MTTTTQPTSSSATSSDMFPQGLSLQVERKHFTFELKENPRGRFLRITEEVNGRYDAIVIPITGLEQFRDKLTEIVKLAQSQLPPA